MADTKDSKPYEIPSIMADLEWVWVLTSPTGDSQDSILIIEMQEETGTRRVIPLFSDRDSAKVLKRRFTDDQHSDFEEQTMRLGEVGRFAAKEGLEMMLLDATGRILVHMEAQIEESYVH